MSEADGQKFLKDLDKKLWPAANTQSKRKPNAGAVACRDIACEVPFIDSCMVDRVPCASTDEDTERIVNTFHAWNHCSFSSPSLGKGRAGRTTTREGDSTEDSTTGYRDISGLCKSATLDEIAEHGHVFTTGRYVGAEDVKDDGVPFAEKMEGLTRKLATQFHESELQAR